MAIPLESLTCGTFTPLVGQSFTAAIGEARIGLTLGEVRVLGHKRPDAPREPFSLTFRGACGLRLPQGIHRLACDGFGEIELFITQVAGGSGREAEFEAIFT